VEEHGSAALRDCRPSLCELSHHGFWLERPQRQSATVLRVLGISLPSASSNWKLPRTSSGPSRYSVITTGASSLRMAALLSSRFGRLPHKEVGDVGKGAAPSENRSLSVGGGALGLLLREEFGHLIAVAGVVQC
jgi:hypothetical protein